jgi:hypothetical protein
VTSAIENPKWIPVEDTSVFYEGKLEATDEAIEKWQKTLSKRGTKASKTQLMEMPVVTIGEPQVYPLDEIIDVESAPPILQYEIRRADFFVVHFACSFRPAPDRIKVLQANHLVKLSYGLSGEDDFPIAFDLHPDKVETEIDKSVNIVLSPELSFKEFKASIGEVSVGWKYSKLEPDIESRGINEQYPEWVFSTPSNVETISGSKGMLVLIKAKKQVRPVIADVQLTARCKALDSPIDTILRLDETRPRIDATWILVD